MGLVKVCQDTDTASRLFQVTAATITKLRVPSSPGDIGLPSESEVWTLDKEHIRTSASIVRLTEIVFRIYYILFHYMISDRDLNFG